MVRQKATSLSPKHSLSATLLGRKVLREKPVPRTAPGGKRNPSATQGSTAHRIVSYCADILEVKVQMLPTGNRSISAMGWFCLACISQPRERPDCLVSGFTDLWHVGRSSNTTSSVQRPPLLKGRRAHCRLSPQSLGISWWLRGAQLQAVLPSPELLREEELRYTASYICTRALKAKRNILSLHGHSVVSG